MKLSGLEMRVLVSAVGYTKQHIDHDIAGLAIFPVSYDKLKDLFDSLALTLKDNADQERRKVFVRFKTHECVLLRGMLDESESTNHPDFVKLQKLFPSDPEDNGRWWTPDEVSHLSQYVLMEAPETSAYERLSATSQSDEVWRSIESRVAIAEWSSFRRGCEVEHAVKNWTAYDRQILVMALKNAACGHIGGSSMYFRELIRSGAFDFGCSLYVSLADAILP